MPEDICVNVLKIQMERRSQVHNNIQEKKGLIV